jgi:flagellar motor switch/type III secretory pathway protein FliN
MSGTETATVALTMLAAAPIEVVAEIGRIVMRADEVAALRAGSILELGPLNPQTVELRVGGRGWARGELVDVDGKLGVRLTAISPGPNPLERSTARAAK